MSDNIFSKKCDLCHTQPAILFFRSFNQNSNNISEEGLCPKCALKKFTENSIEFNGAEQEEIINTINHMRYILSDIVKNLGAVSTNKTSNIEKCSFCNTTSHSIKHFKKAGCSFCYEEFKTIIKDLVIDFQFSSKHKGQIPKRYRHQHFQNLEIEKLQSKLQTLLRTENYEEAAKINKRISKLLSKQIHQ